MSAKDLQLEYNRAVSEALAVRRMEIQAAQSKFALARAAARAKLNEGRRAMNMEPLNYER